MSTNPHQQKKYHSDIVGGSSVAQMTQTAMLGNFKEKEWHKE